MSPEERSEVQAWAEVRAALGLLHEMRDDPRLFAVRAELILADRRLERLHSPEIVEPRTAP